MIPGKPWESSPELMNEVKACKQSALFSEL
jgi:hypothetical protein